MKMKMLLFSKHFIQAYKHSFDDLAKEYGFTQLEIDVLLFLYNNPALNSAQDIVEYRGFSKSNVSNAVESLRKYGYIVSKVDNQNRRIQRLTLVSSKADIIKKISDCQLDFLAKVSRGLSTDDLIAIDKYLQHIDANAMKVLGDKK